MKKVNWNYPERIKYDFDKIGRGMSKVNLSVKATNEPTKKVENESGMLSRMNQNPQVINTLRMHYLRCAEIAQNKNRTPIFHHFLKRETHLNGHLKCTQNKAHANLFVLSLCFVQKSVNKNAD